MKKTPESILKEIFGYDDFRSSQKDIVNSIIDKNDTLVLMPTGAGKSICYQVPALYLEGCAIVISPLISLMQNQINTLKEFGVRAEFVNSTTSPEMWEDIRENVKTLKLLYISPERFQMESFRNWLKTINISFFAIDEAHCVSRWGHDFRPDYSRLSAIKEEFGSPIIALTATADLKTRQDIPVQLKMNHFNLFISNFDRPNIKILVEEKNNYKTQLLKFLENFPQKSGIIYCLSRKKVDEVCEFLNKKNYKALSYHAGMNSEDRKNNQDNFLLNEGVIVVATIAFGMGIDKPDVRFVVHLDMPQNLESFYQEIGRAGREGENSVSYLLYSLQDFALRNQMIIRGSSTQKMSEIGKLNEMLAFSETLSCKRNYLMKYFGNDPVLCQNCESCLNSGEKVDVSSVANTILSFIKSTNNFYAMTQIVLILKGSESKNINDKHKSLKLYGSLKDVEEMIIKKTIRQMIVLNFIKIDLESGYNNLIYLKDMEGSVFIRKESVKDVRIEETIEESSDLFSQLKSIRLALANKHNIPPYLVLHDKSLKEMVKKKPQNLSSLKKIHGWGDVKIKKYGETFLEVLKKK